MAEIMENITDDEDFLELINIVAPIRRRPTFRNRLNHFEMWTDIEFLNRFRLPKEAVRMVINLIQDNIANLTNRNHSITPTEMVLLTLRFYASGSMMIVVADFVGVDKSTACRIIHKVSYSLANLYGMFIKMPRTNEEIKNCKGQIYEISRFPKCIGVIDCTHIKIQSPGGNNAEIFRNRKGYFSYNVQAVCDASLFITNMVCRWPGSSHDSTIFNNSRLRQQFENGTYGNAVLVGDSGYPIRKYLMTPLANPVTNEENLFNESLIRTRNSIERCFGVWKKRFPILALGLRVKPDKIEAIVIATAVLHNLARSINAPDPEVNEEILHIIEQDLNYDNNNPYYNYIPNNIREERLVNMSTRVSIINNHFALLQ